MDTAGRIGGEKVRKKTKGKPFLPDDIIPNILCRLPAKNASQCRLVCKGWRDLTLAQDFVDLNFRHCFPMVMVVYPRWHDPEVNHILLDEWWEPGRRNLMIHTFLLDPQEFNSENQTLFSHAGLIVFKESYIPVVIILNPINLEKVTISLSKELRRGDIYGVFFHRSLREYCSLWGIEASSDSTTWHQPEPIQYKMLNLGSSPFMKTICNPFPHGVKKCNSRPLFIDKYLYWMLKVEQDHDHKYSGHNDIMQFDIILEEFSVKPCPVPVNTECNSFRTHLLNIDGALSFLVIFPCKITIWRLEDHAGHLWTTANYTFSTENFESMSKPIAVVDGNLALLTDGRLHVCNLKQGTVKSFRKRKYHDTVFCLPHQMSLASLRNCQSTIYIDDKGEVDVRVNSWNSGSSNSLAGSSNSNSLVNEGSDSHLDDSGPSNPLGEKSMSFEIASTDDDEEGDWKKKAIDLAECYVRKGSMATKQDLHNGFKAILELLKQGRA